MYLGYWERHWTPRGQNELPTRCLERVTGARTAHGPAGRFCAAWGPIYTPTLQNPSTWASRSCNPLAPLTFR